jgi:hypothetical protein
MFTVAGISSSTMHVSSSSAAAAAAAAAAVAVVVELSTEKQAVLEQVRHGPPRHRRQGQAVEETTTCILGDGTHSYEFQSGESFGNLLDPGCSNTNNNDIFVDFSCFCNPNKHPNPVDCPYCSFETNTLLDDGVTHEIVCARHDETIQFIPKKEDDSGVGGGQAQSCSCHVPLDALTSEPITICQPLETPGSCTLQLSDGTFRVFANGESLGDIFPTQCTPMGGGDDNTGESGGSKGNQYPCFCNVDVPGQIYCPYCRLLDYWRGAEEDPFLICVRHEETVLITDKTGIDNFQCTCSVLPKDDPLLLILLLAGDEGTANCVRITESPTMEPTEQPSTTIRPPLFTPTPTSHQPIITSTEPPRSFPPSKKPAAAPTVSPPDSNDSTTTVKFTVCTLMMSMAAVVMVVELLALI